MHFPIYFIFLVILDFSNVFLLLSSPFSLSLFSHILFYLFIMRLHTTEANHCHAYSNKLRYNRTLMTLAKYLLYFSLYLSLFLLGFHFIIIILQCLVITTIHSRSWITVLGTQIHIHLLKQGEHAQSSTALYSFCFSFILMIVVVVGVVTLHFVHSAPQSHEMQKVPFENRWHNNSFIFIGKPFIPRVHSRYFTPPPHPRILILCVNLERTGTISVLTSISLCLNGIEAKDEMEKSNEKKRTGLVRCNA